MDSLKDLEIYVDDAVSHFMTKMRQLQHQSVNMGLWVQLFAFGTRSACQGPLIVARANIVQMSSGK